MFSTADPTLTTENLMELLGDVKEQWSFLATGLGVSTSQLQQINSYYQMNQDRLRASLDHWISSYPCSSWLMVATVLDQMDGNQHLAEVIRIKYIN